MRAYDRHEEDLKEYFRDRPGDFLTTNLCGVDGWGKLSGFLGLPAPREEFPHQIPSRGAGVRFDGRSAGFPQRAAHKLGRTG